MAVAVEHQTIVVSGFLCHPASEKAVYVGSANLDLRRDGSARNPLHRREFAPNGGVEIAVLFGTHSEYAHVDSSPFRTGHPQFRASSERDRTNILRALRFLFQKLHDAGQHMFDRPGNRKTHAGRAVTKSNQMFLGSMHVIVVAIPVGHDAVEYTRAQVERYASYRRRTLFPILNLSVGPTVCAYLCHVAPQPIYNTRLRN